jgi:hypothetical protein
MPERRVLKKTGWDKQLFVGSRWFVPEISRSGCCISGRLTPRNAPRNQEIKIWYIFEDIDLIPEVEKLAFSDKLMML